MALLVVGSVAFDSIRTPHGEVENVVGGSATFFSVSASFFAPVRLVAVVGEDFRDEQLRVFAGRPIDTAGLERAAGDTFRWRGRYLDDMNEAQTLETKLNVFEHFAPKIPAGYLDSELVFLGNIDPVLQRHVREQLRQTRLVACDSMNFWIKGKLAELKRTLAAVDALIINEAEARMLSGMQNLQQAVRAIQKMGPRIVVVKRGEYGVVLFADGDIFSAPGYPLEVVRDPTGAGDTFAGGFMGYLAQQGELSVVNLRRAVVYGSVMASFVVEDFGLARLLKLTRAEIDQRFREFKNLTHFEV
jgi:sugar/nucleoside kinase (ribokinase family)